MSTPLRLGSGWRSALAPLAFILLIGAVALCVTTASAGAPTEVPAQGKPTGGGTPTPSATPTDCSAWNIVPSPNGAVGDNAFYGIAAVSSGDVWAVGYSTDAANHDHTLIARWDGNSWTIVPGPNPGSNYDYLYGIAVAAPDDVWAVGYFSSVGGNQTLIEHWDGSAWSIVPSPNPGSISNSLDSVAVSAPNDVWAVGNYHPQGSGERTLVQHWDGSTWMVVPSPNPVNATNNNLDSVTVVSSDDVWAVGGYNISGLGQTLVEHWDGSVWSIVSSPNVGTGSWLLDVVAAGGPNDVWAVGAYNDATPSTVQTLIERWDGSTWSVVPSPNPSPTYSYLWSVAASGPNDVWAVGTYRGPTNTQLTLIERWDGTSWNAMPSPNQNLGGDILTSIGVVSADEMWVGGGYSNGSESMTLTEHYTTGCFTPSPTSTPVPPSSTPSRTPTSTVTPSPTPSATSTPISCPPTWSIVSSPNQGSNSGLQHVAAVSANDVWAVGGYNDSASGTSGTLAEHWNGVAWSIVPSPNQGANSYLWSVSAVSANDVWAVGGYRLNGNGTFQTLVEHWNGVAWSIVPSPNQGPSGNYLNAVVAVSAGDVWAMGNAGSQTLVEHWNGTAWSIVPSPNGGSSNNLYGVAAVSANDVWAVGFVDTAQTLVEHWNGTSWSIVPSPSPGSSASYLDSVSVVSANDVWAVGYLDNSGVSQPLMEHWDGTAWSVVPSPGPGPAFVDQIYSVSALSTNDVWAVGRYQTEFTRTLVEHWDGTAWSQVSSPNHGSSEHGLFGVVAVSADEVWAVGDYSSIPNAGETLVEHYAPCNPTSTATPLASATSTSTSTSTVTLTPTSTTTTIITSTPDGSTATRTTTPTATPTTIVALTPTICPIQFTDVPEGSTFYPYIRCLACRGIINGYPDGTFKPNNNVTRGQLSKIVANADGLGDPQPDQVFQDVPVGSTFQAYTGRLASRGYMAGYPCGGAGEPCMPPNNLSYFRPNANATRGQISKIVSNAAGFQDPISGQTFEDVPVGSPFYTYTTRLAVRGIMGGYQCGGAGEPCVPPDNRPYFRPNANATRGQTSKIVANAFFPGCQTLARP